MATCAFREEADGPHARRFIATRAGRSGVPICDIAVAAVTVAVFAYSTGSCTRLVAQPLPLLPADDAQAAAVQQLPLSPAMVAAVAAAACAFLAWRCCSVEEEVVATPCGEGFQLQTRFRCGLRSVETVAAAQVRGVFLAEAVSLWSIYSYLAVEVEEIDGRRRVVLPFRDLRPGVPALARTMHELKESMRAKTPPPRL